MFPPSDRCKPIIKALLAYPDAGTEADPIAEADETNVQQALDSLLIFPLDAQTVLGGDVDLMFRVSGKATMFRSSSTMTSLLRFALAKRFVSMRRMDSGEGFPEQLLQQQADAGFSLAALAGHDQHLLRRSALSCGRL